MQAFQGGWLTRKAVSDRTGRLDQGQGRATAELFASERARVIGCDLQEAEVPGLESLIGLDLADPDAVLASGQSVNV